jgi:protein TonB
MVMRFADEGMPRLLSAVALSLLLHAALIVAVGRNGGGDGGSGGGLQSPPLVARLTAVVSDAATAVPVVTESSPPPVTEVPDARTVAATAASATREGDGAAGVYYFKASELDRRPFPLTRIEVPAPESDPALAGAVMIRLRISESGRIDDARIMMSTGAREFEEAALREFTHARFHPGYRANVPVRSEMLIEVTLRPDPQRAAQGALPAVAGSKEANPQFR